MIPRPELLTVPLESGRVRKRWPWRLSFLEERRGVHGNRGLGGSVEVREGIEGRRTARGLTVGFAVLFASACTGDGSGHAPFVSIGTGAAGGIYYALGGALAGLLSLADSTRAYTTEVTAGAAENVNRISAGQIDLAFSTTNTIHEAYFGGPDFGEPMDDLRIVAPLYPNFTHVLVSAETEARSVSDFGGLRVSVGAPGSGTEQMSRRILEVHGLTYDDVDARYLTLTESAAALKDRAIDAALISAGYPLAAVREATAAGGVGMISIEPDRLQELMDRYPYFDAGEIPAGTYPGVDEPVQAAVLLNWVVAPERLSNDVVRGVLTVLTEERMNLERVHNMVQQIDLDHLQDSPIPLHPGTEQWWIRGR